jgi:hypothetical protein
VSEDSVRGGSDSAVSRLERRARLLLRAYPPGYRRRRGEEILGTLLEATPPGRSWPPARDLASVLRGGVRARRDANRRQGAAASVSQAAILAIALYLAGMLSRELGHLGFPGWSAGPLGWKVLLPAVPLAAAVVAAWRGRLWVITVTAVAAGAAIVYRLDSGLGGLGDHRTPVEVVSPPTAALLLLATLVLLAGSSPRPPRSWLWLPGLPMGVAGLLVVFAWLRLGAAVQALGSLGGWVDGWAVSSPYTNLFVIMVIACACWLVTDFRPLLGLALGFAMMQVGNVSGLPLGSTGLIGFAVPLAVAGVLVWLLSRLRRVSPPALGEPWSLGK